MLALSLSLLLFAFWTVVGQAFQSALKLRFGMLRSWLLAPGIGIAVVAMPLMIGSQAGYPIGPYARPLALILGLAAAAVLLWRRPLFPWRALWPFVFAVFFSLLWCAWPALKFGFSWVSFVNDDFTNYCLAAERFKDFGFFRAPTHAELAGSDYTQYYWFMHAVQLMRFGSEHALAWLSSITGRPSQQVFMPAIVAFGMAQIFAVAGLVLYKGRLRRQARWTALMLAFSPMFMFGSLYQLIAQVSGMSLLITLIALLTAHLATRRRLRVLAYAVPTAIVGTALCLFYPEVTPFAVGTVGLFIVLKGVRTRTLPGAQIVLLEYTILGVVFLLRYNLISYIYTLARQYVGGTKQIDLSLSLFPFFLIPSGLSSVFGLQPMNLDVSDPWGSILIAAGLILMAMVLASAIRGTWRLVPVSCLLLVDFAFSAHLYRTGNDFGLYKSVMFMQPALMAALAAALAAMPRPRWLPSAGIAALFAATAWTGLVYTRSSAGVSTGVICEINHASDLMGRIPPAPPPGEHWTGDIDNVSAVKLAAASYRGTDIKFVCRDYFDPLFVPDADWPFLDWYPHQEAFALGREYLKWRRDEVVVERTVLGTGFKEVVEPLSADALLDLSPRLSLFNKLRPGSGDETAIFAVEKGRNAANRLVFVHSNLGNHYYLGDRRKISYFQQQPDYFQKAGVFNGIGRFLLLRVEHPSDPLYLRVAVTKTLMGGGRNTWSPGAAILGKGTVPLGAVGSGALNLIAGPVSPVWFDGTAYIALDFDQPASQYPIYRTGLKALYNTEVNLDYRRLVAYARDISALSPEERDALPKPRSLSRFPLDLVRADGLEFSGIYEDGWLSPDSEFILGAARAGESVRIRGYVPELPGAKAGGELVITINRGLAFRVSAPPGPFSWVVPVAEPGKTTRVALHFTSGGPLPNGDGRPAAAKLDSLDIGPTPVGRCEFAAGGSPRFPCEGVDQDGWAVAADDIALPVNPSVYALRFEFEYPGWPGIPAQGAVSILIEGQPARTLALKPGTNSVTLPLMPGSPVRHVHLQAKGTFRLPAPDGRERAFRLLSVEAIAAVETHE
jgi:hypothetical protein